MNQCLLSLGIHLYLFRNVYNCDCPNINIKIWEITNRPMKFFTKPEILLWLEQNEAYKKSCLEGSFFVHNSS